MAMLVASTGALIKPASAELGNCINDPPQPERAYQPAIFSIGNISVIVLGDDYGTGSVTFRVFADGQEVASHAEPVDDGIANSGQIFFSLPEPGTYAITVRCEHSSGSVSNGSFVNYVTLEGFSLGDDLDEDGIPDDQDQCINVPEDLDGFQDDDGCPEGQTEECPEFVITPTLPPASDPRELATPSDSVSYRMSVAWSGSVPVQVYFGVLGADDTTIVPDFTFNPTTIQASPLSVLLHVTTQHAALGTYPLTVNAEIVDPDSGKLCTTSTTVTLVVSEESFLSLIDKRKVDNVQGDADIIENDYVSPAEEGQEIRSGVTVRTGQNGNVGLSSDDGHKTKIGRSTTVGVAGINSTPSGGLSITLPPDAELDPIVKPPIDDSQFWKDLGSSLVDAHKVLGPQIAETALACVGAVLGVEVPYVNVVASAECFRQSVYLLYNGQAYFTGEPKIEGTEVIVPGGPIVITPNVTVVPLASEFSIEVADDGATSIAVLEGPVWVMDVKSKAGVFVYSNEQIVIPNTSAGLSDEQMKQSVAKFGPGKTNIWWAKPVTQQFQIADYAIGNAWEDTSPYRPIEHTTTFNDQDGLVYAWIKFMNVLPPEHTVDFKWYQPDGTLYMNQTRTIEAPGREYTGWTYYVVNNFIYVKDNPAALKPGLWKVDIYTDGDLVKEIPFTIEQSSAGIQNVPSECLIATAAFGSELTPQVQFLRGFRDNHILSTAAGASFMSVFNSWYYSFSPYVADFEREQPWLQQVVKIAIYPLLGILTVSEKAYTSIPGEYGAVTAGIVASSMIGAVYFWPAAIAAQKFRRAGNRLAIVLAGVAAVAAVVSLLQVSPAVLMATTSLLVLAVVAFSALFSARLIGHLARKRRDLNSQNH